MKFFVALALWLQASLCLSGQGASADQNPVGMFSAGSRNTISLFNEDGSAGKGIGAQFRLRLGRKLNSEWFLDYITSGQGALTYRNDYHIGWSLMFYMGNNYPDDRLFQPYFIAGHCFDRSRVAEKWKRANAVDRLSMATQAGLGTHINITSRFDCSLSGQYMMHFGKDIDVQAGTDQVIIRRADFSKADGHLLFTLSLNYKIFRLWRAESN